MDEVSTRISIPSRSESERRTDEDPRPSVPKPTPSIPAPEHGLKAGLSATLVLPEVKEVKDEIPIASGRNQKGKRRNNPTQTRVTTQQAPKPTSGGWGSWGDSFVTNIPKIVATPDRIPSPELFPVKPKIQDPPKGFIPSQPPKSQPAESGLLNQPAWGAPKPGPTPIAQKIHNDPSPIQEKAPEPLTDTPPVRNIPQWF